MNDPILSIIIPSYNTSKYVDECLPTFIDEKLFGKVIIYLIDDGATDDIAGKIKPYVEKYPQLFHFVHKENGGHGSVINYGVHKLVKTKYFKVIDGDDWVITDALVELVDYLSITDDDAVVSSYKSVRPDETTDIKATDNDKLVAKHSYDISFVNDFNITIHSITYKTSIFLSNKIYLPEKVFYEDNLYRLYPFLYVKTISFILESVYCYRLGNPTQSISTSSKLKHMNDSLFIRNEGYKFYSDHQHEIPLSLSMYFASVMASGMGLYRTIVSAYKANKETVTLLKSLYEEDKKYPLVIKEFKKSKFHRFLFFFNCNLLSLLILKHFKVDGNN